ncbi:MAG TPA: DUF1648 domain-containing protein, partial [Kribbellaceae bacterium]
METLGRTRRVVALALVAVPFVVVGVALLTAGDLPDPVPTHWNIHGDVNGTMSRTAFTVMVLVVTGAAAVLAAGFVRAHEDDAVRRWGVQACAFTAYLVGGLALATVLLAAGVPAAAGVRLRWYVVPAVLVAALGVPAVVHVLWPVVPVRKPVAGASPRLDLAPGERAVYVATLRSRGMLALGVGCAVVGVVLLLAADLMVGAVVLAVTVALLALSRVTLRVDDGGMRLGFGPGVRVRVPLERIERAEVADIRPMAWGGWGYRARPGGRALVLR